MTLDGSRHEMDQSPFSLEATRLILW